MRIESYDDVVSVLAGTSPAIRPVRSIVGLQLEFTRDPELIQEYQRIYEAEFRAVHGAMNYCCDADKLSPLDQVLIVKSNGRCVGGARLSVKSPKKPDLLPVETESFRLEDVFPVLRWREMKYGQIGRFCLLPEFRGGATTRLMLQRLYQKGVAQNIHVIFGTAPLLNAKMYVRGFTALGYHNVAHLHDDVTLPDYPMCEGIHFYLMSFVGVRDPEMWLLRDEKKIAALLH